MFAYLTIDNAQFKLSLDRTGSNVVLRTSKPEEVIAVVMMWELDSYMCSSTVDFPEEEGMSEETVEKVRNPDEEMLDTVVQLAADCGWKALKEEKGREAARLEMVERFNAAEVARQG